MSRPGPQSTPIGVAVVRVHLVVAGAGQDRRHAPQRVGAFDHGPPSRVPLDHAAARDREPSRRRSRRSPGRSRATRACVRDRAVARDGGAEPRDRVQQRRAATQRPCRVDTVAPGGRRRRAAIRQPARCRRLRLSPRAIACGWDEAAGRRAQISSPSVKAICVPVAATTPGRPDSRAHRGASRVPALAPNVHRVDPTVAPERELERRPGDHAGRPITEPASGVAPAVQHARRSRVRAAGPTAGAEPGPIRRVAPFRSAMPDAAAGLVGKRVRRTADQLGSSWKRFCASLVTRPVWVSTDLELHQVAVAGRRA